MRPFYPTTTQRIGFIDKRVQDRRPDFDAGKKANIVPTYHKLGGYRFYDNDTDQAKTGTAITDNSTGGAKTLLKFDLSANTVTYEDGPEPIPNPPGVEYYVVADLSQPVSITRF